VIDNRKIMIMKLRQITLLFFVMFCYLSVKGQVTIGSDQEPNSASILDLKEFTPDSSNANSKKGLAFPRVILTDLDNLYPMFESPLAPGSPTNEYSSNKNDIDEKHTGLLVYNVNNDLCNGFKEGLYVWNINRWVPLNSNMIVTYLRTMDFNSSNPTVITWRDSNTPVLHIPSGIDLQTLAPQDLKLTWYPYVNPVNIGTIASGAKGPVSFNSDPPATWSFPANSSPHTIPFQAAAMDKDALGITPTAPWYSLETIVPLRLQDEHGCGNYLEMNLVLNQTNYALLVKPDNQGEFSPRLKDDTLRYTYLITPIDESIAWGNYFNVDIASNARWKSEYVEVTPGIIDNIAVPDQGGQELIQGENPKDWAYRRSYTPVRDTSGTPTKNKIAGILTLSDTATIARFYPAAFTFVQCVTGIDDSDVPDKGNATTWGANEGFGPNKVLKHTDQNNNVFYSAQFGIAGRWMTSNLAATSYASGSGLETKDLIAFDNTTWDNVDSAQGKYAYTPTIYDSIPYNPNYDWNVKPAAWDPSEGLLYNWFAATGREIDQSANSNVDEGQSGINNTPGGDEVENIGPGGNPGKKYFQGICPDGWHLPSDREWNMLEKEIFTNPDKYSVYGQDDIDIIKGFIWNPDWEVMDQTSNLDWPYRGIREEDNQVGHGAAMKERCNPVAPEGGWFIATKGYSEEHKVGGFNAKMGGWITSRNNFVNEDDKRMIMRERGYTGAFWASSKYDEPTAWTRLFNYYNASVIRLHTHKTHLQSVRCKKNE